MPKFYDPMTKPVPQDWLELDEGDRISQAEKYHKKNRIRLPNTQAHALFHVIVENQIAEDQEAVVRAMQRLSDQGLDRHESLHAVAWVLSQHIYEQMTAAEVDQSRTINAEYISAIERLNLKDWLASQD